MIALSLAWRQLRSQWASGEVQVLLLALVLAVAATTAVGFFTDRIQSGLVRQGGLLLGADLVVSADHALPEKYFHQAQLFNLQTARTLEFPSMVIQGEASQLAQIKAVSERFPLRGDLTIGAQLFGQGHTAKAVPEPGSVWIEPRLATMLKLKLGDTVELGERTFRISAFLLREPSRGGDMFNFAPRLMMNIADVESTGLIQFGSRVRHQLLVTADAQTVKNYGDWAKTQIGRGERVEDVRGARPEMRSALEKAQQFLGLSAMVSVILAMVAMWLASLPYVQRSLDTYALMRCFGASKRLIVQILLSQTLLLALFGSVLGCLLGFAAQAGLAVLAGQLFLENLPSPSWWPALSGIAAGFATMLAVVWPHLRRLRDVPALRILRRDLGDKHAMNWLSYVPALVVLAGLVFWHAGSIKLGGVTLLAFFGLLAVIGLIAFLGGRVLHRLPETGSGAWRLGLAGLKRRPAMAIAQIVGFSLGLMALILLALVRGDLLHSWQSSLPPDAPNRFIINIQPAQIDNVKAFFSKAAMDKAEVYPMVRGRLIAINEKPLDTAKYEDDRARRLAEREFNLSWAAAMQADNELVAGRWWRPDEHGKPMLSLEKGLAETLGIKLGDKLTYDIAGTRLMLTVTSLRKVEWDTMRANFFAVTPPQVLNQFPASHITSFHLPLGQEETLNQLIRSFPNLTVIDVAALMEQVRGIMNKMTHAVEYVFGFSLLTGIAVLYAALVATREERVREATLLRVLGAKRRQVVLAALAEFFSIGVLAAVVATIAASALAYYISTHVLNIPYRFNAKLALLALIWASILVPAAAWFGVRGFLNQPPRQLLQSI
ncbi:MAG TPA: FtsX-like permease family protein [Methylophilaceae bacterium]|nr:FtsX-like permease family protein [Methylophilaceae bacterium]